MNNIISYIEEYGDRTFEEFPFNEVDSLVLCQLSYLNYDGFVGDFDAEKAYTEASDILYSQNCEDILKGYWYTHNNRELFSAFSTSKRFGNTKLAYYVHVLNESVAAQFAAITYILPDKSIYVAFRGTDATLIGWKEDMKLAYSEPIRSQELAADYLDRVSDSVSGQFRIGGHSKGGNLAVYAAMFCAHDTRKKIIEIFDNDGPGFRPEILKEGHFTSIRNKIHKYIPRSSIVGILLEDEIEYEVIECWSIGTLQHNTYVWKSNEGEFIRSKGMTETKKRNDSALNEWIYSLSDAEVSTFIDALFDVLTASNAKNVFDLIKDPTKSVAGAFGAYKDMDQKSKDTLRVIIKRLIDINEEKVLEEFIDKSRALKEEMKSWQKDASLFMTKAITKKKQ